MEGGAVDALLLASDDILRSVEFRLGNISWRRSMVRRRMIPSESRTEGVQEQRPAEYRSSRRWCPGPTIGARAPLHAPLLYALLRGNMENHICGCSKLRLCEESSGEQTVFIVVMTETLLGCHFYSGAALSPPKLCPHLPYLSHCRRWELTSAM